jgi:hypothetical protein
MTKMADVEEAMNNSNVFVSSVILGDDDEWVPIRLKGDVWCLVNRGSRVPLLEWLAHQTHALRAAGKMGPNTTATINNVKACVLQRGEPVWLCPNSPAWTDHLTACRFDMGEQLQANELQAACRAKHISDAGTEGELQGRLDATIEDLAGVFDDSEDEQEDGHGVPEIEGKLADVENLFPGILDLLPRDSTKRVFEVLEQNLALELNDATIHHKKRHKICGALTALGDLVTV